VKLGGARDHIGILLLSFAERCARLYRFTVARTASRNAVRLHIPQRLAPHFAPPICRYLIFLPTACNR